MTPEILPQPSKIICVGQNYAAHARGLGNELPSGAGKLDYEVELGVVEIADLHLR